jgi:hypothetical protein
MSAETETKSFEQWCVVEIMGHKRFAGLVTEQTIGGNSFVRIDVPATVTTDGKPLGPFTKLFGAASIYCLTPCTEETARAFAAGLRSQAFDLYEVQRLMLPVHNSASDPDRSFVDDDDDFNEL